MQKIIIMIFPLCILVALFSFYYDRELHLFSIIDILRTKNFREIDFHDLTLSMNSLRDVGEMQSLQNLTLIDIASSINGIIKILKIAFEPIKDIYMCQYYFVKFIVKLLYTFVWNIGILINALMEYLTGVKRQPLDDSSEINPALVNPTIPWEPIEPIPPLI